MTNRITLITGASGGIGAELARIFAHRGYHLVLVARSTELLEQLAKDIADGNRHAPRIFTCDLEQADAVDKIANYLSEEKLEVEFVVNNAGYGLFGKAADLDRENQLRMIDLNVRVLTDLSLRFMDSLKRYRGGILNVASIASFMPGPGMAVYYASKSYVLSFTEALHQELRESGVRVTALCPGPVKTGFQARAGFKAGMDSAMLDVSARDVAQAGFDGLIAGQRIVLPGVGIKILARILPLVPRGFLAAMVAKVQLRRT